MNRVMNLKVRVCWDYWEKKLFPVRILEDRTESWTSPWFPSLKDLPERLPEETKNREARLIHMTSTEMSVGAICV